MTDHGADPFVTDIEAATLANDAFRSTLWTGTHLQLTVMCVPPGGEVGLEVHHDVDQFLRVEQGHGLVQMGPTREELTFEREVGDDDVVLVPAGSWHNL
ncbi:MAG: cupin domain-containing protein, partial [Dermatophilaceae bacterium]